MRLLLAILLLPLVLPCAGQDKAAKKRTKPVVAAKKVPAKPQVPPGAVQTGPDTWRYTDEKGENWIYRRTPFGMTRIAAPPESSEAKTEAGLPQGMKAVQVGDEIQFERSGPFGITRWSRKPDQLTDIERKVWERDRPKQDGAEEAKDTTTK